MTKKVTNLSDLGKLILGRNADVAAEPAAEPAVVPTTYALDLEVTMALRDLSEGAPVDEVVRSLAKRTYRLGQQQAKAEAALLHDAVVSTHEKRNEFVVPAAVAAIMEQTGMNALSLDMASVATVFTRCNIDYQMDTGVDQRDLLHYRLTHLTDKNGEA